MSTELEHLRAFRAADGAPDLDARAAARAALLERIEATAAPVSRGTARRRARRRLLAGGLGLAAAAAAVALVVGLGSGGVQPATAAEALRQAAVVAEQRPDVALGPGQYWYTRSEGEQGDERWVREEWQDLDGSGRIVQHGENPLDAAIRGEGRGSAQYSFFPRALTYAELGELPTDVDALYARMREAGEIWADQKDNRLGPEHEMFTFVGDWLRTGPPLPAALRAALYRVAARLPGVELLGTVRDARGRSGTAVALSDVGQRRELVFDAATAALLEERTVRVSDGHLLYRSTYLTAGVVDSTRERPVQEP